MIVDVIFQQTPSHTKTFPLPALPLFSHVSVSGSSISGISNSMVSISESSSWRATVVRNPGSFCWDLGLKFPKHNTRMTHIKWKRPFRLSSPAKQNHYKQKAFGALVLVVLLVKQKDHSEVLVPRTYESLFGGASKFGFHKVQANCQFHKENMTDFGCFCLRINTSLNDFGMNIPGITAIFFRWSFPRSPGIIPTNKSRGATTVSLQQVEHQPGGNSDWTPWNWLETSSPDEFQPQDPMFELGRCPPFLMEQMITFRGKFTADLNSQSVHFQFLVLTGLTMESFLYPQNTSDNWFSLRWCFVIWRSSIVQWISPDAWTSSGQIMTVI